MIVTIHQPEHMPWLGYFNKIAKAEKYVILDNVQYRKGYVQNRNRILGTNGVQWLGVPILTEGYKDEIIKTTQIANERIPRWREKYLRTIEFSYKKHPFFEEVYEDVRSILKNEWQYINDLNVEIFSLFAKKMGISPEFVFASDLNVEGNKSDLILNICKKVNADIYISGPSGRKYLDIESFNKANISVVYNDYNHPSYEQKKASEFVSHLSALDLFMNQGYERAYEIIMNDNLCISKE